MGNNLWSLVAVETVTFMPTDAGNGTEVVQLLSIHRKAVQSAILSLPDFQRGNSKRLCFRLALARFGGRLATASGCRHSLFLLSDRSSPTDPLQLVVSYVDVVETPTAIPFGTAKDHHVDPKFLADRAPAIFPRTIAQEKLVVRRIITSAAKQVLVFRHQLNQLSAGKTPPFEHLQCIQALPFKSKCVGL